MYILVYYSDGDDESSLDDLKLRTIKCLEQRNLITHWLSPSDQNRKFGLMRFTTIRAGEKGFCRIRKYETSFEELVILISDLSKLDAEISRIVMKIIIDMSKHEARFES